MFDCEKRRFASRIYAKQFASKHHGMFGRQRPYFCDNCEGWHLTSASAESASWHRERRAA